MKLNSTHTIYKEADVACSRPQLVLMLLDAAGRYSREAASHLRAERWAEKGQAVDAAFECLAELRKGLDMTAGGEAAANLDQMYDFLITKLTIGNASRDAAQFDQVAQAVQTLRDAWEQLFERLRAEGKLVADDGAIIR
ncbi:MAG TPA: flagellar export chaperone FliS [bacterium]